MRPRKLQVFLSSTYTDLVDLRLAAIEAILAAGHIPATMEQFAPGDETALEIIERWIAESDAFVLMLGGRYGSIEPKSGKSYVQLEYELALKLGKPFFAMLMSDDALQQRVAEHGLQVADERENQGLYRAFKEVVKQRLCRSFTDGKDVRSAIFQKLPEWSQRPELAGWIHASEAVSPQMAEELARLSKENAELRAAVGSIEEIYDGLTFTQLVSLLRNEVTPEPIKAWAGSDVVNSGMLFDKYLAKLSPGWLIPSTRVPQAAHDAMKLLVGHGLVTGTYTGGSHMYELTQTGRCLRNRMLTLGSREERARTLWGG